LKRFGIAVVMKRNDHRFSINLKADNVRRDQYIDNTRFAISRPTVVDYHQRIRRKLQNTALSDEKYGCH
jgi:predicted RNA-binding protein